MQETSAMDSDRKDNPPHHTAKVPAPDTSKSLSWKNDTLHNSASYGHSCPYQLFPVQKFGGLYQSLSLLPAIKRTCLYFMIFKSAYFCYLKYLTAFVTHSSQMNKNINTRSNLPSNGLKRKIYSHQGHGFKS